MRLEITMTALKASWVYELVAFVLLGALASLAITSVHGAAAIIFVLLAIVLVIPRGLAQGFRKALSLRKSFRWWHGLWLLVYLSGLVFRIRDVHDISEEPVDAWALFRIALIGLTASVLLMRLALRRPGWLGHLFRGLVGILATYALICVASTIWSIYPEWTLYKSLEYLVDVALLAAILATVRSTEAYRSLFDWTWALYGFSVALAWLEALVWPQDALVLGVGVLGVQIQGFLPAISANSIGEYGAVIAIVALSRLLIKSDRRPDKAWYRLLLAVGLITMVFAQTRSAIAGFLLGALLVLLASKRVVLSAFLGFATILLLSQAAISGWLWEFLRRGESDEGLRTFSSRVTWWGLAWQKFVEHPLLGYGAYAGGRFAVLAGNKIDVSTLHSDFAELIVGTGLLGVTLAVILLLGTWWVLFAAIRKSALDTPERQLLIEAVGVFGVISMRSVFTPNLFSHPPLMFLVILGYAEFLRRRTMTKTDHSSLFQARLR